MSQHSPVLPTANISWHNGNPYNQDFNDYYYSKANAVAESSYVFLKGNHISLRWQEFETKEINQFNIIETGFGGGLNFLNTAKHWLSFQNTNPEHLKKLVYTSIEGFPLTKQDFKKITDRWDCEFSLTEQLVNHYPPAIKGIYSLDFDNIELKLILMPVDNALAQLQPKGKLFFDCLYLDGFSPSHNESMWDSELLRRLSYFCKTGSTFSTYTSASDVRKSLINIGYAVKKVKGFGAKREMLAGTLERSQLPEYKTKLPWFEYFTTNQRDKTIAIIGGGVAGCATAYALARKGIACTLIDSNPEPGGTIKDFTASSYSPYITADFNHISQFIWHGYKLLEQYLIEHKYIEHEACGVFHVANNQEREKRFRTAYKLLKASGMNLEWLETANTKPIVGIKINHQGLFYHHGGWVNAKSLCASLINQPLISPKFNTNVLSIQSDKTLWHIQTDNESLHYDNIILCGGAALNLINDYKICQFDKTQGQITSITNTQERNRLKTIVNNGHYLIPNNSQKELITGSNYDQANSGPYQATIKADLENLIALKDLNDGLDKFIEIETHQLSKPQQSMSNSGIRLASRDHLPIIGPVPDMTFYSNTYPKYIQTGRLKDCPNGRYIEGLFVNTAHGSRGVTSSLLSGEIIAAILTEQQLPLPSNLYHAVHPARFFVRDQGALKS